MLSVGGLAAAGDSLTDEYVADQGYPYALTWFEALGASGVNVGDYRVDPDIWPDVRERGYEYNWAQAGATSGSLLGEGQHTGLAQQVNDGDVTHAVLAIGQNDYWPLDAAYQGIYAGLWTQAQIDAHNQGILANMDTALATLTATDVKLVMSNVIDYGVAPLVRGLATDVAGRQRVADAISQLNEGVKALAAEYAIPLVDSFALTKDYLGEHGAEVAYQTVGGVVITNTAAVDPHNGFVHDGIHPHTVLQAVFGNCFVDGLNLGYAAGLDQFSELEMLTLAGIGGEYAGDTLALDYSDYVILPCDFGDAPDPFAAVPGEYPTMLPGGARHTIVPGFHLGELIDGEVDGQPTSWADGDDTNGLADEDGVLPPDALVPGQSVTLTIHVTDEHGLGGSLNAWIDLDQNGDWLGAEEHFFSEAVDPGLNELECPIPADASVGPTYVRFRLSTESSLDAGGPAPDGEVEDYQAILVSEDLGQITFDERLGLDSSAGDLWYAMETSWDGYLTLEATYEAAGGTAELTLYDAAGAPIDTSSTGSGTERVEHEAAGAGEVYYARLAGANTDVDLSLINMLQRVGTAVYVWGTDGEDSCTLDTAASRRITVNGVEYDFDDAEVDSVLFMGGAGDDRAVFDGSAEDERVIMFPGTRQLALYPAMYTLATTRVETVTANSGGGNDVVYLYDSLHDDTFTAGPDSARMAGPGFTLTANNFRYGHGYASDDGHADTASLLGRDGSADLACVWPSQTRVQGTGFNNRVRGFGEVHVTATDASDVVKLYPDGGDTLEVHADSGSARLTLDTGPTVEADGFSTVIGISLPGNGDTAHLYGTPGDDTFVGQPLYGYLAGNSGGSDFFLCAKRFDQVFAYSNGGDDVAHLHDSAGIDVLEAYTDRATMTYQAGNTVQAEDFRWVNGYSKQSANDVAHLYDTTADLGTSHPVWFRGEPGHSRMYSAGYGFFVRARLFETLTAHGTGDDDVAHLYDSALDDQYWARPDHCRMDYGDGTSAEAIGYRYMHGYSENNGNDTATLYDETAGGTSYATTFYGYNDGNWARLFTPGYGFFSRTRGFREVRAALEGDNDSVYLYDDPARDDHLVVPFAGDADHAPGEAKFWNDQRAIYVDDFYALHAHTSEDGDDDKHIDPSFDGGSVFLYGNWTDV